ncbi:hypothetical protein [Flavobacterium cerinum]|nr:hypothetical protein [Flavobacterium cerinum]
MNTQITLYALQKFEQGRHNETVYYTEWDDVLYDTRASLLICLMQMGQ